jgi:tripartite-type tricarboxylate transporter receptor subunit TctC
MVRLFRSVLVGLLCAASFGALAQSWPSRPVRILISNSAGSSPDITLRLIADRLGKAFNQSFIVENRPGGEQLIAADLAAKSAPDGYTLYLGTNDTQVGNLFRLKPERIPFNPDRDFVFVGNIVGSAAFIVAVNAGLPVKSFPDLVAHAKANPGRVNMGVTVGLADILARHMNKLAGIDMVRVPYKSNPQANQDLASGQIQATIISYVSIKPFVDSGKSRLIAVTGTERYPLMPDLPTLNEAYPGLIIEGWWFLQAPAGTPPDIVQRLIRETDRVVADPEVAGRIHSFHFTPGPAMTQAQFEERVRVERARWKRLVEDIGLKPE